MMVSKSVFPVFKRLLAVLDGRITKYPDYLAE
jgi:hypothetical protein